MIKVSLIDGGVMEIGSYRRRPNNDWPFYDIIEEGSVYQAFPGFPRELEFLYPGKGTVRWGGVDHEIQFTRTWLYLVAREDGKNPGMYNPVTIFYVYSPEIPPSMLDERGGLQYGWASSGTFNKDYLDFMVCVNEDSEDTEVSALSHVKIYTYDRDPYWESLVTVPLSAMVDLNKDPGTGGNPYEPGGPSGPGTEPPGTFDDDSDPIPDSSLPTISAANTGFTRIYNPTLAQVQDLARYLWTDETVIQTIWNKIKQYFEDPMQAIIGFNLVPVTVPNAGTEEFKLMYIGTGVNMTVAANQFVDVDCGSLKLQRYYGSALDQSPNTRVSCFLPYIGTVHLNTDEVMGTTLQVKYRVDIVSGSCLAKILVDGNCLYQYSGHCAITIPIGASDFSSYVTAAISVGKLAVTAGLAAAGAGAAALTGEAIAEQQTNNITTTTITKTDTVRNPTTGRQVTAGTHTYTETVERPVDVSSTKASYSGLTPANIANTVGQVISAKPNVEHSGSFSGNTGYLGIRRPFLIIERPNMCMPQNYQKYNGFPCMITLKLGDCRGYTRVQQIQLTGMMCTNPEQAEILQLLKSGVII